MWLTDDLFVNANLEMRAEEAQRARAVSEARTHAEQGGQRRSWPWRAEAGTEDVFQDLLGWLLSSQRDAEIETAAPSHPSEQQASLGLPNCCRRAA